MPKEYYADFINGQMGLIKSNVQVAVGLFLAVFISATALGSLVMYKTLRLQLIMTWGLMAGACAGVFMLARMAKSINTARVCAYLMVAAILVIMIRTHISINNPPMFAIIAFIIMLFASTFLVPWRTMDILALAVMHMVAFTCVFFNVPLYEFKGQVFAIEFAGYFQGLILLAVVFVICAAVTKRENERKLENFILFKEVEKQNSTMQKELELATRVHKRLIPRSVETDLADIAVTYHPMSYMGGDYAKFQVIDKTKLLFMICDVTGHGVSAALLVNALNTEFERLVKESGEPGILLRELDKYIRSDFAEINMFLTAFCGLLDYRTKKFTYSSYGHPPQYMYVAANTELKKVMPQTGMLGLPFDDDEIYQSEMPFSRKDKVFLFTDGVVEAKNDKKEEYGEARIEDFLMENQSLDARTFNKSLLSELNAFSGYHLSDDVFVLSICTK